MARHPIVTVAQLLDEWPSRGDAVADIGVNYWTLTSWIRRGNVPPDWWPEVIDAARHRGLSHVTAATLRRLYDSRPQHSRSQLAAHKSRRQGG